MKLNNNIERGGESSESHGARRRWWGSMNCFDSVWSIQEIHDTHGPLLNRNGCLDTPRISLDDASSSSPLERPCRNRHDFKGIACVGFPSWFAAKESAASRRADIANALLDNSVSLQEANEGTSGVSLLRAEIALWDNRSRTISSSSRLSLKLRILTARWPDVDTQIERL